MGERETDLDRDCRSICPYYNANMSSSSKNNIRKRIFSQTDMIDEPSVFHMKKLRIWNVESPNLLPELLANHIIPYTAKDWLGISKDWNRVAYDKLQFDPRIRLNWKSLERAISCHSIRGVSKHIYPMTKKEYSISVWYILDVAIENDSTVIAKYILEDPRMADCNTLNEKLWKAVRWDRSDIVTMLLQHPKVDLTQSGARAVYLAINLSRTDIIDVLRRDERVRRAEQENAVVTPWAMPPQPRTKFSGIPQLRESIKISDAMPSRTRIHVLPHQEQTHMIPIKGPHLLLDAVAANDEETVKSLLKEELESIPINTLHEAVGIAINSLRYKLTNLIQRAINRRMKAEVHEPNAL